MCIATIDKLFTCSEFVDAPIIYEYSLTLEYKVVERKDALGEMHIVHEVVYMLVDELEETQQLQF